MAGICGLEPDSSWKKIRLYVLRRWSGDRGKWALVAVSRGEMQVPFDFAQGRLSAALPSVAPVGMTEKAQYTGIDVEATGGALGATTTVGPLRAETAAPVGMTKRKTIPVRGRAGYFEQLVPEYPSSCRSRGPENLSTELTD